MSIFGKPVLGKTLAKINSFCQEIQDGIDENSKQIDICNKEIGAIQEDKSVLVKEQVEANNFLKRFRGTAL